jgi:hypothetical protein
MLNLYKPQRTNNTKCINAYAGEADAATLEVSPDTACLSCHDPAKTHQRWSSDVQVVAGPSIGFGANVATSISDSTNQKATVSVSGQAGIGISISVTEDARAGTDAMPTIVVTDSVSNSSPDSLGFISASPDNTGTGN